MRGRHNIVGQDTTYEDYLNGDLKRQRKSGALLFWSFIAFILMAVVVYLDRQSGFLPHWLSEHADWMLAVPVVSMVLGLAYMIHAIDRDD